MTFTRDDRTLLGNTPEEVARALHNEGADVIGVNCSGGPAQMLRILADYGCVFGQGYHYSKPVPADKVNEMLCLPAAQGANRKSA